MFSKFCISNVSGSTTWFIDESQACHNLEYNGLKLENFVTNTNAMDLVPNLKISSCEVFSIFSPNLLQLYCAPSLSGHIHYYTP